MEKDGIEIITNNMRYGEGRNRDKITNNMRYGEGRNRDFYLQQLLSDSLYMIL